MAAQQVTSSSNSEDGALDPQAEIEAIAAENGMFSDLARERAKHDPVMGGLLRCAEKLKRISNNATIRIAKDLNSTETHFILECIQNADDNQYIDVEPFLRISVYRDRIRIDCNEKGFEPQDVKSLCSVGESKKVIRENGQRRYIGEKGIGFKSVFKVAERVQICSPPYFFEFDARGELGMITPIWVPPEKLLLVPSRDSQTTILLLPPSGKSYERLIEDSEAISPTLLLFLSKLRRMDLRICTENFRAPNSTTREISTTYLRDEQEEFATLKVQDTHKPVRDRRYRLFNQTWEVSLLEVEERRKGIKETEVRLAFPVNALGEPIQSTQPVHAFLPVRDFGFKFLIQADFLVTSSRQDLEESKPWNLNLRNMIPSTFVNAIVKFTSSPDDPFRYTWMRFLPQNINHCFWKPLEHDVLIKMRQARILESRAGTFHCPQNLRFLTKAEMDRYNEPLIGDASDYVSKQYHEVDHGLLQFLGVQLRSWTWFLNRLTDLGDAELQAKPNSWHEDIAKCLIQMGKVQEGINARNAFLQRIKSKNLIPLQDGAWTSAQDLNTRPIYFREGTSNIHVPSDISLRLVRSSASANEFRKKFFKLLGVKDCDTQEVAFLILAKHQATIAPDLANAITHAEYLYALDPAGPNLDVSLLWLYDDLRAPAKGFDLYIRDTTTFGPGHLFPASEYRVRFLSPEYDNCPTARLDPQGWRRWLIRGTGLADFPYLQKLGAITPEFEFIIRRYPDDVIHILKKHWVSYHGGLNATIRQRISCLNVLCSNGQSRIWQPLYYTFAPDPELQRISTEVCNGRRVFLLHIEHYIASEWCFLREFGVGLEANAQFYVWLAKQTQFREDCTLEHAKNLLRRIVQVIGFDVQGQQQVRAEFSAQELIFVPLSTGYSWATVGNCVWDAPQGFRPKYSVRTVYGEDYGVSALLQTIFQIHDATIKAVVDDLACSFPSDDYLRSSYSYFANKLSHFRDYERQVAFAAFSQYRLILIGNGPHADRMLSSECVWGGPPLTLKRNIELYYSGDDAFRVFFCSILGITTPSWHDLLNELRNLKANATTTAGQVEAVYAYMFKFSFGNMRGDFEAESFVYGQDTGGGTCWKRPSEFVWNAPFTLQCKKTLRDSHGLRDISAISFLQYKLGIEDAGLMDYVEELRIFKRNGESDLDHIKRLYRNIELHIRGGEDAVRHIFNSEQLIYDPSSRPPRWMPPQFCLWSGPRCLLMYLKLSSIYAEYRSFFCTSLGIRNATPATLIVELNSTLLLIEGNSSIRLSTGEGAKRMLDLILELPKFNLSPGDLETIHAGRYWPCRPSKDAPLTLVSCYDTFFIPDHPHLLEVFDHNIPVLDLAPIQVGKLKDLFLALGLMHRFLSVNVAEIASATDTSSPAIGLSRDMQQRAMALYYCAVHFGSGRARTEASEVQRLLQEVNIYHASDILTTYEINSQGINRRVEKQGLIRLAEEDGQLKIFIPRQDTDLKEIFSTYLPKEIMIYLGISGANSLEAVTGILHAALERLEIALDRRGILRPGASRSFDLLPADDETATSYDTYSQIDTVLGMTVPTGNWIGQDTQGHSDMIQGASNGLVSQNFYRSSVVEQNSVSVLTGWAPRRHTMGADSMREVNGTRLSGIALGMTIDHRGGRPSLSEINNVVGNIEARRQAVIEHARFSDTAAFNLIASPSINTSLAPMSNGTAVVARPQLVSSFDMSSVAMALPAIAATGTNVNLTSQDQVGPWGFYYPRGVITSSLEPAVRSGQRRVNDFAIGFLGEQYIVTILKDKVPGFNEHFHWTSTLREYAGLPPYPYREMTDLTFPDNDGHLSRLLLSWSRGGMVPGWLVTANMPGPMVRPTFWLEVKTTPGVCETPFYVSNSQYRLMETLAIRYLYNMPENVYVLLRVSEIHGDTKVTAYIDPWIRGQEGRLDFTAQGGYAVTPRTAV